MKSKTTAALLAIFVGGLGIHKFYLGKNGQGLLYLLFCWLFIPSIIAFVEGILFLVMDDRTFDMRYNMQYPIFSQPQTNVAEQLEKLFDLKQKRIITQEEFERKKQQLL